MDYTKILEVAKEAATLAGNYLEKNYRMQSRQKELNLQLKSEVDLVTKCDLESQEMVCDYILSHFPDHSILAEEDLNVQNNSQLLWVIDPIDGTTNFAHSLPMFSVSIAFFEIGRPVVGVLYIPILNEMFHAVRGTGAFLNGGRISVSDTKDMNNALLATGFPYDRRSNADEYIGLFKSFLMRCRGVRRMGSAAIDMAYVATGRFDGFWERGLHPWDTGAGVLLVEEAGGKVTGFAGQDFDLFGKNRKECLASNGTIHQDMLTVISASGSST